MKTLFSLKYIKENPFHYLLTAFSLLYFAGTTEFTATDQGLAIMFLIYAIIFFMSGHKLDIKFVTITLIFILVNLIPILFFQKFPPLTTFIGFYLRLISGYFIVSILGENLLLYLEDLIVKSAIISLPLYLIQISTPSFFTIFSDINLAFGEQIKTGNGMNILFFHINGWSPDRNSGFMWEPGAYGMVLGLAIILTLIRNNFRFTASFFVLIFAAISTFSTTTYLNLLFISLFILFNKNFHYKFMLVPLIVAAFVYTLQQSFVTDKIISTFIHGQLLAASNLNYARTQHVNRIAGFFINIEEFLRFPLGYTFLVEKRTNTALGSLGSANGLSEFIQMWGIAGIIFLYKGIKGLFLQLQREYKFKVVLLPVIAFLIFLFSNPITRTPLFFALMFLPLLNIRTRTNKRRNIQPVIPKVIPAQKSN